MPSLKQHLSWSGLIEYEQIRDADKGGHAGAYKKDDSGKDML